eukprot:GHUV01017168.1.p1 GENE.GHUV01017168.1~~GHUV01017168.1.p1  ORF type:complete len:166 (+),score=31.50 GHUV01017168.1:201-698(+)
MEMVKNGAEVHPGAIAVEDATGRVTVLAKLDRKVGTQGCWARCAAVSSGPLILGVNHGHPRLNSSADVRPGAVAAEDATRSIVVLAKLDAMVQVGGSVVIMFMVGTVSNGVPVELVLQTCNASRWTGWFVSCQYVALAIRGHIHTMLGCLLRPNPCASLLLPAAL